MTFDPDRGPPAPEASSSELPSGLDAGGGFGDAAVANGSDSDGIERRATWGIGELVIGAFAVLALFVALGAGIVYPAEQAFGEDSAGALAFQAVTIALWDAGMVVIVYMLARRNGGSWRNLGFRAPRPGLVLRGNAPWTGMLWLIVLAYFCAYAVVALYSLIISIFGLDELLPEQQISDAFYTHDWVVALLGLSIVFTAPFAEETFFRGFLFAGLRRRLWIVPAALISGALFSLAHADLGLIVPFTGVGVVLALTYERAGTLYAPMGVHVLFNLVSFLILVFVPEARD